MSYLPMLLLPCYLPMHSSHCISHHLFAAAHYCETHRIHLIAYTCSFCLCPRYPARIPGILSQTHLYAMHLDPSPSVSISGRFVFHLSVSIIFIFLSTHSHYSSRPDICRLLIPIGFCLPFSRHLIDSSAFYLFPVRSRLDGSFGPFSASLCST